MYNAGCKVDIHEEVRKKRKEKKHLRKQKKLSLHQFRKRDTLAQKSLESPPPRGKSEFLYVADWHARSTSQKLNREFKCWVLCAD
eukprot:1150749-Pelagomonas_calceolata.AAC.8